MYLYTIRYDSKVVILRGQHSYYKWLYEHCHLSLDITLGSTRLTDHCKSIDIGNAVKLFGV